MPVGPGNYDDARRELRRAFYGALVLVLGCMAIIAWL